MGGKTRKYVLTGLMTALVFILTYTFKVPVPYTSGYIHFGDSMIYVSVLVLGPIFGAFASGVGSMMADIIGGFPHFALPTFVIKSLMALIMGLILSAKTRKSSIASVITALLIGVGFLAGTSLFLNQQITTMGSGRIIETVAGADADAETLSSLGKTLGNLPLYLLLGVALLIVIFAFVGYFIARREASRLSTIKSIVGMIAAGMCMVMGYFLVECFMYSPIAATFSIPMNLIQFIGGVTAAILLAPALRKARLVID